MENAEIQDIKSVIVTNISPSANEKTVSDFFSFCGKISKLYLKKEEGKETNAAVIQFETESAAKTALLLTNALIVDRPITVSPFVLAPGSQENAPATQPPVDLGTPVDASQITQRDFGNVSDEQRTKTSVVASLLAAGYVLSNDALDKAKEFDDKHGFSRKAQHAVDQIKVKAHEIDVQLGITDKANAVKNTIEEAAKKIDNELHITERAQLAAQAIKTTAQSGIQKAQALTDSVKMVVEPAFDNVKSNVNQKISQAQENPTVKKGVETMKNTAQKVSDKVTSTFNEVKQQTKSVIEEKQKEKRDRAPSASEPVAPTNPNPEQSVPPSHQPDPAPQ